MAGNEVTALRGWTEIDTSTEGKIASPEADAIDGVIKMLQHAKRILREPSEDRMKGLIVQPVLKDAMEQLANVYVPYKPKRGSKT